MLKILYEAERLLPELLMSADGWSGLLADTEKPNLARVWRQWGENRISLHEFGDCLPSEVFPHPHAWDSAIRIVWGQCEMAIDYDPDPSAPFEPFAQFVLPEKSAYEMLGSRGRHWVRPTFTSGYRSVMVSGPPRYRQNHERKNVPSRALEAWEIERQLRWFRNFYPKR